MTGLVSVADLTVRFDPHIEALRGLTFSLDPGEAIAVVGETGAGKSTLALCLLGLIQPPGAIGSVRLDGVELIGASAQTLRDIRWQKIAIALQNVPFNPVMRIGQQIAEPMRVRLKMSHREAQRRTENLAGDLMLPNDLLSRYPHELSGGERRRAGLAMAMALDPQVVVLDEPTAGVDPSAKLALCQRISELRAERGFALIVITHDLSDARRLASRCLVLYAGEAMEEGPCDEVLTRPVHPYTWALVNAYPSMTTTKDLRPIRGTPPDSSDIPSGCPFHPRCTQTKAICTEQRLTSLQIERRRVACHLGGLQTLLTARSVSKRFGSVQAVDDVTLSLRHGEALGIIGLSGSGKTTLARILAGHLPADSGEVTIEDARLPRSWRRVDASLRRRIQLVMQNPWDTFSPRLTVEELLGEPIGLEPDGEDPPNRRHLIEEILERVALPSSGAFLRARPHQLSGGQLQRLALARALLAQPTVLVADEPTATLDASEQARMLVLLRDLQGEEGLGLVLISHDIAVVRKVTDRIVVLEQGQIVEEGLSNTVSSSPRTEIARCLVASAARLHEPPDGDEAT